MLASGSSPPEVTTVPATRSGRPGGDACPYPRHGEVPFHALWRPNPDALPACTRLVPRITASLRRGLRSEAQAGREASLLHADAELERGSARELGHQAQAQAALA